MRVARVVFGLLVSAFIVGARPTPGAAQAPPAPAQRWDGLIERLSTPEQWQPESFSNPRMSRHAVSGDGRYFVFVADVANPPYDPTPTLFIRDRMTGRTTLFGGPVNGAPVTSSDGNHTAFEFCDMFRLDGQRVCDVWAMDTLGGSMQDMSTSLDGTLSHGDSSEPMLSRDGRFIVFRTSSPALLPPGAAPGQIVLRDRDTDGDGIFDEPDASSIRVVSVSSTGEPGNFESAAAEVSDDGRFVAFRSRASNLVAGDTNDAWDVFVHDVESGETRRVNVGSVGEQTTSTIDSPAISMSADGAFIAFATDAALVTDPTHADDNNNALDVMLYDRAAGTVARVDLGAGGAPGNGHTLWPSLSADGRYVAVVSNATNVENPGTPGRYHVFVYDRATSQATRVSVKPDGSEPDRDAAFATISADGSLVTFVSRATNLPTAAAPDTDSIYAAVHFDVTPLTLTLPARGGDVTAAVTAQRYVSWGFMVTDWNWLNWGTAGAWGMGDGTATFQAARNQNPTPRTTTAVANSRTITITQEAGVHVATYSPAQGPATGGTQVTIAGGGFEPGMRVFFDGVEAPAVEFLDKTSLRAVTPPHAAGDAWLYVATADWQGAGGSLVPFRYTDVTPPLMYPPWLGGNQSEDGWFTSDVQIAFGFYDPDSAIISSEGCMPPQLMSDTPGTTYTCTATSEGGTSSASVTVKRDATPPAVDITAPAQTIYKVGDPAPLASYTCTDALNTVTDCTGLVPLQQPVDMTPGYHDFWVSSRDRLGNWGGRLMSYAVTEGVCAPRPEGLVAWFPFDGTYTDLVGLGQGTPVNMQFVPGAVGSSAVAAAGSPSYVTTDAYSPYGMTAFTLAAWVKPGAATGDFEVIAGREGEYMLGIAPDGTLHWSLSTATHAWGWTRSASQLHRNVWAHVALVYDGSQVTIYVNGVTREGWSISGPIADVAEQFQDFRIGGREDPASPSSFSGAIDDVLLAKRAFSSIELQQIALAADAGLCAVRPTTVTVSPDPVTVPFGGRVDDVYTLRLTSGGIPVAGRTLYFFDPTGLLLAPAETDANGQIRFGASAFGASAGTHRGFEARFMGDLYYAPASGTNVLVVEPALPVVTWTAPASIAYGTPLGPAQLNASADVPGTFTYTPEAGTPLSAGTHTLSVQFTPTSADYRSASASTTIDVTRATPTIAVTAPSAVYDGLPHGATGTVTGVRWAVLGPLTFTYNGAADSPVNAGSYAVVASYAGDANYSAASATATITIGKASPVLQWTAPAAIAYGTPLSDAELSATANVGGTLAYTPAAGTVLAAGTHTLSATFTPADPANYTDASASTTVDVTRATPAITVTAPSAVYDGQPHDATGTVTGVGGAALGPLTFTYNGAAGAPVNAGSYAVVASFAGDANYTAASAAATITIAKATTVLQWPAPAAIPYGTPLGAGQLNATANIPGTFTYSPVSGTVLGAGGQALSVSFMPADPANYTSASSSATISVTRAPLTIRAGDAFKRFGAPLPPLTVMMTGFVNGESAASLSGALVLATTATPQSAVGTYPIVPSGLSSANYAIAFVSGTLAVVRGTVDVTVVTSPEPSGLNAPMTFTASVSAAAPAAGNPAGLVRFFDGATLIGTAPVDLDAGTATLSTAGLDPGTRTIEARYDGDGSFEPGTGSAPHVIRDASQTPSLALSSSRNPSSTGQTVTLTATVSMAAGPVSGVVEFYDGAVLLATSPISAGRATFTTASWTAGSHAITARYTGANGVPPAQSAVFVQATGASGWKNRTTSMTVSATPNPGTLGDTVTVAADVSGSSGTPTGRILFMVDGAVAAEVAVTAVSNNVARATLAVPGLAHGRHTISATYLGDPTYKGNSNRLTAVVN